MQAPDFALTAQHTKQCPGSFVVAFCMTAVCFVGPNATVFVGLRYLLRDAVIFTATVTQADGSTVDAHTATFEDVLCLWLV